MNKETAVAAMKYMDWMAQPENMFYLQNGIEGVHYDHLNEDGLPVGRVTIAILKNPVNNHQQ